MPTPDATRWRVCASGNWHSIEGDSNTRIEDNLFVSIYPRIVDIQWHVNNASREAVLATAEWLLYDRTVKGSAIALGFHFGAPNNEVYDTPIKAAQRLLEIAEFSDMTPFVGTIRKRLMLDRAFSAQPETAALVDCWLRLGGELRPDESDTLAELLPKVLLFRHVANDNSFIYSLAGPDSYMARFMGPGWSESVVGRRAEDCWSDASYEDIVCADYLTVIDRNEGRFHHIRAIIDTPYREACWINYERLALPWSTKNGEPVLMIFTHPSQNLDIPFLSASC